MLQLNLALRQHQKRLFSTTITTTRAQNNLVFAKRCENGQGSSFAFTANDQAQSEGRVDVSYSTFWNDFTHYSFYSQDRSKTISSPVEYDELIGKATEDMLFADKEKFVDVPNSGDIFSYREEPSGKNKREIFTFKGKNDGHFCAHIPQDFNIDVRTNGDILGVNPGESKLLALKVHLESQEGSVTARRLKTDDCYLQGERVQITSSIEAAKLACTAGPGGFSVSKRIGIGKQGRVDSLGLIKIGSIFSNMRELPEVIDSSDHVEDLSIEKFFAGVAAWKDFEEGLTLTAEDDIQIDNMQGVVALHTSKASKISLHTVESAKMVIDAPNAHVTLNLKSIHDLSHIHCASAEIILSEAFDACNIYDQKQGKFFENQGFDPENLGQKPLLKVLATGQLNIKVMSDFEILKRQIMSKMQARKANIPL